MVASVALKSDGPVWSSGYDGRGQLEDNSTTNHSALVQLTELTGVSTMLPDAAHTEIFAVAQL